MLENIVMIITHILKTIEVFTETGFREIPLDQLPEAAEALFWQFEKMAEIYAPVIVHIITGG